MLLAVAWWKLLHRSTSTLPEALRGMAVKLCRTSAGWPGLSAHRGWSGLEGWLKTRLHGSINIPLERAEGTTSEPPEHLFSAGFHLKYPPKKLEAKLCHLCSSWPPVQQRKVTHCGVIPMQISPPVVSSVSDSSESTSHRAAAFPPEN